MFLKSRMVQILEYIWPHCTQNFGFKRKKSLVVLGDLSNCEVLGVLPEENVALCMSKCAISLYFSLYFLKFMDMLLQYL